MSLSLQRVTGCFEWAPSREPRYRRLAMQTRGTPFRGAKPEVTGPTTPATDFTVASNLTKTPGNDKGVCGMLRGRIWRQEKNRSRLLRSLGRDRVGARGPCVAGGLERADYSTTRADRDTASGERD